MFYSLLSAIAFLSLIAVMFCLPFAVGVVALVIVQEMAKDRANCKYQITQM